MIKQACIYNIKHFPSVNIDERFSMNSSKELTALAKDSIGWQMIDDELWYARYNDFIIANVAYRFRRVPKSLLKEHVERELNLLKNISSYEKKQIKIKVFEKLLTMMMPEKIVFMVLIDLEQNTLSVSSQNSQINEKVLRLVQETFPGIFIQPKWSKDSVRKAIHQGWKTGKWPVDMLPDGDVVLTNINDQRQKIRFTSVEDLDLVNDCARCGYNISGLRLSNQNGLSCFINANAAFQGMRYPPLEDDAVEWLGLLEFRSWCMNFGAWVGE